MSSASSVTAVILAGGQGARFWPMSRMKRPKQFLSISASGESLIQATARRIVPLVGEQKVIVVTNILHEPLIREHVPTAQVISEPCGKNTAASIALGAVQVMAQDPEGVMIVLPADHAVRDEAKLCETLSRAVRLASEKDLLVAIGVPPLYPHTGYGYIQRGAPIEQLGHKITRFFEKPNLDRAQKYVESGSFFWNSGMFVWKAKVILEEMQKYMPGLYQGMERYRTALAAGSVNQELLSSIFDDLESLSIDFGILEHSQRCGVVEASEFGWNDVGSWDAWSENFDKDSDGNLLYGDALLVDSTNCVVHSQKRLIAGVGLSDVVIIDSGDAILVCPRSHVQEVRKIVDELKKQGRKDLI